MKTSTHVNLQALQQAWSPALETFQTQQQTQQQPGGRAQKRGRQSAPLEQPEPVSNRYIKKVSEIGKGSRPQKRCRPQAPLERLEPI